MRQHIGTKVFAAGEKRPMTIIDYHGINGKGSHMFLCELASKATRLYSGQRLRIPVGRGLKPLLATEDDDTTTPQAVA